MTSPKILVIGEAYGAEEEKQGKPFVGPAGRLLRRALEEAGFDLRTVDFNNVCMWRPSGNRQPTSREVEAELPRLQELVKQYQWVILAGRTAHSALHPMNHIPFSMLLAQRYGKFFTIWHPSYIIYQMKYKPQWINDLRSILAAISNSAVETASTGTYPLL